MTKFKKQKAKVAEQYHMPGSEALDQWLRQNDTSAHAFGLSLRRDPGTIRDLINGKRSRVDVELADMIQRATDGAISWRMWIPTARKPR